MNKLNVILAIAILAMPMRLWAQDDDSQADLRVNPVIEEQIHLHDIDYGQYKFLTPAENKFEMNGADWNALRNQYEAASRGDTIFSVLYLGDSHIQADFGGAVLRECLAEDAGGAGRGFITPFKLAGTNEPNDYSIRIDSDYLSSRLLKMPWATDMTFSGVAISPLQERYTLDISCKTPFDRCRLFYSGGLPEIDNIVVAGDTIEFIVEPSCKGVLAFSLPETLEEMSLSLIGRCVISGIELAYNSAGTFVHSIGNNGATYSTYGLIDDFGSSVATLGPDLILIALGTNEAFSSVTGEAMIANMDNLISILKRHNPDVAIALITPTECFKKKYVRRKVKGRRRRTAVTVVNDKAAEIRSEIVDFAKANNIPIYDTFAVMGGRGAAEKMKNQGVLSKDGVHFTADGYRLQGNLLADALLKCLKKDTAE